ncbi:AAA family ATPase [Streptomyces sp. NPDC053431]|uniref:helix-turn-helix transcriptional regulator n=1 Tax=Streptomyces sp. NPDC053431 TaxID=3365703 RepID=UPI0037D6E5BA
MANAKNLLERTPQIEVLTTHVKRLTTGAGAALAVEGMPGIGKSRLLSEASSIARAMGIQVLSARGTELEREFAYGLVRQLFETHLVSATPEQHDKFLSGPAAQARELFPLGTQWNSSHLDPGSPSPSNGAEVRGDFPLLNGLFWLLVNVCQDSPVLLVADDLHWADEPSLRFFLYLLPRLADIPVSIIFSLRPEGEKAAAAKLLTLLSSDSACHVMRLLPLGVESTRQLIHEFLGVEPDDSFAEACHKATGGNPLWIRELSDAFATEKVSPTIGNLSKVESIGPQAVRKRVKLRLAQLEPASAALAQAAAVLGDGAELNKAAALAGLAAAEGSAAASDLTRTSMVSIDVAGSEHSPRVRFVHPLVRSAIEEALESTDRLAMHERAAILLDEAGAEPERVAAHLLKIPPATINTAHITLRTAAEFAMSRGSPEATRTYLLRCLEEPLSRTDRIDVLTLLGAASHLLELSDAAGYLRKAVDLSEHEEERHHLAAMLAVSLHLQGESEEALRIISDAISDLDSPTSELSLELESFAAMSRITSGNPGDIAECVSRLQDLPETDSRSGKMIDCAIAFGQFYMSDPEAVPHAMRCLSEDVLLSEPAVAHLAAAAWHVLVAADHPQAPAMLDAAVGKAHRFGSITTLAPAYCFRGLSLLWRGFPQEAERDMREAARADELSAHSLGRAATGAYLAEALIEQGNFREAEKVLEWAIPNGTGIRGMEILVSAGRARLLRESGSYGEALTQSLTVGASADAQCCRNPALLPWRSDTALCLHALSRAGEAIEYATEEVELARVWGAPRALGRALRVMGVVSPRSQRLHFLEEAVAILRESSAQLELAKALLDQGSILRSEGYRKDARNSLQDACTLFERCGVSFWGDRANTELVAAGARRRRIAMKGLESLTPSERRVAEFAAKGYSNREIAQRIFVTPKTVEVHLSNAYRKLGVASRRDLPEELR